MTWQALYWTAASAMAAFWVAVVVVGAWLGLVTGRPHIVYCAAGLACGQLIGLPLYGSPMGIAAGAVSVGFLLLWWAMERRQYRRERAEIRAELERALAEHEQLLAALRALGVTRPGDRPVSYSARRRLRP